MLDLAIAHERGVALVGPRARELIGAPDAADVRAAQSDVIAWYARNEMGAETVTAACRAWYWLHTATFAAKSEAVRWAIARLDDQPSDELARDVRSLAGPGTRSPLLLRAVAGTERKSSHADSEPVT